MNLPFPCPSFNDVGITGMHHQTQLGIKSISPSLITLAILFPPGQTPCSSILRPQVPFSCCLWPFPLQGFGVTFPLTGAVESRPPACRSHNLRATHCPSDSRCSGLCPPTHHCYIVACLLDHLLCVDSTFSRFYWCKKLHMRSTLSTDS